MKMIFLKSGFSMLILCALATAAAAQKAASLTTPPDSDGQKSQQTANGRQRSGAITGSESTRQSGSLNIASPWVQIEKVGANNLAPDGLRAEMRLASVERRELEKLSARGKVEIVSPASGQTFQISTVPVKVKLDPSILTLRVEVRGKDDRVVYDSGVKELPRGAQEWTGNIRLAAGGNAITVTGADKSGARMVDTIENVQTQDENKCNDCDERNDLEGSFYVGYAIDTFAAGDVRNYLNQGDSGTVAERFVGGFDFAFRVFGDRAKSKSHQVWVFGETVHGVRSADVDCVKNPDSAICKLNKGDIPPDPGATLLAILRNATSLEAFVGIRWEFLGIRLKGNAPARLYLKSQAGFLTVAGLEDDLKNNHTYAALGLITTKGRFKNSYLEIGIGKNDVFVENPNRRWKIDGFFSWEFSEKVKIMRPFAQFNLDSDFGRGSDSIQSYFGIDFDLCFVWKGCDNK